MAIFIFIGLLVTYSPIWHQFHCRVLLRSGRTVFLKTVIFGELWCLPYWPDLEVDGILQIQLFFKIIQLSCSMQFKTPTIWSRLEGQIWFRLDNPPGFENETRKIWCRLDLKKKLNPVHPYFEFKNRQQTFGNFCAQTFHWKTTLLS